MELMISGNVFSKLKLFLIEIKEPFIKPFLVDFYKCFIEDELFLPYRTGTKTTVCWARATSTCRSTWVRSMS